MRVKEPFFSKGKTITANSNVTSGLSIADADAILARHGYVDAEQLAVA